MQKLNCNFDKCCSLIFLILLDKMHIQPLDKMVEEAVLIDTLQESFWKISWQKKSFYANRCLLESANTIDFRYMAVKR